MQLTTTLGYLGVGKSVWTGTLVPNDTTAISSTRQFEAAPVAC